jgi:ATP phosphoribosyltransferase
MIRIALPDGHQQKHVAALLGKTGIRLSGYEPGSPERRPASNLSGVKITVIRPQDMPVQVAIGNFDLAISGFDWLCDHIFRFPKSPVEALLDLGIGRVRIVAVTREEVPAQDTDDIKKLVADGYFPKSFFRIASEYVNIADHFGMRNRIVNYRVIPTYGATEALLPEDADLIIENTETGTTLKKNGLKVVSELFVSTGNLIGRKGILGEGNEVVKKICDELRSVPGVVEERKNLSPFNVEQAAFHQTQRS